MIVQQPHPPAVRIDRVHCAAIFEELGYRLRQYLKDDIAETPPQLSRLLGRLRQADGEAPARESRSWFAAFRRRSY